jgi:rubrerythrin
MDFEDDFFDECEGYSAGSHAGERQNGNEDVLNPFNLRDPELAHLLWSDDAQGLANPMNSRLKCLLCGHQFEGRKTDSCPMCYAMIFREGF